MTGRLLARAGIRPGHGQKRLTHLKPRRTTNHRSIQRASTDQRSQADTLPDTSPSRRAYRGSTRLGTFPAAFSSASPATSQRPRHASAATLSPGRATGSRNKSPVYHLRTLATTSETRRKSTQILALSDSWAPCGTPAGNRATSPDGVVHRASPGRGNREPALRLRQRATIDRGPRGRPPWPRIYVRGPVHDATRKCQLPAGRRARTQMPFGTRRVPTTCQRESGGVRAETTASGLSRSQKDIGVID